MPPRSATRRRSSTSSPYTAPGEFDQAGQPRKGTRAAKLRAEVDAAATSRWRVMVEGTDARVHAAEERMQQLVAGNAVALARLEHDRGLEGIRKVRALVGEVRQVLAQVRAPEARLLGLPDDNGYACPIEDHFADMIVEAKRNGRLAPPEPTVLDGVTFQSFRTGVAVEIYRREKRPVPWPEPIEIPTT